MGVVCWAHLPLLACAPLRARFAKADTRFVDWGMQKRHTRSVRGVWGDEVPLQKRAASERTQCAFYARARSAKCVALNDSSAFRRNAQATSQRGTEIVLMGVVC